MSVLFLGQWKLEAVIWEVVKRDRLGIVNSLIYPSQLVNKKPKFYFCVLEWWCSILRVTPSHLMENEAMGVFVMELSCSLISDAMHWFYMPFGQNHLGVLMVWIFTVHWVRWFKQDLKPQPMPFIGLSILLPLKVWMVSIQVALGMPVWHLSWRCAHWLSGAAFCLFRRLYLEQTFVWATSVYVRCIFLLFWGVRNVWCLCKRCQHLPWRWIQAWHLLVCIKPD